MNKIIFKGILAIFLGVIVLTGCHRIPAKDTKTHTTLEGSLPVDTYISLWGKGKYSYDETFEFEEDSGFFSSPEAITVIYTPEDQSGFITLKTRGKIKIKSLLIRSRKTGNYVKLERPVIINTSTESPVTSFYLNEGELVSLLQIIQQEDITITINSYSDYRIVRHRKSSQNRNMLFASSFERVIQVSREISRS